ncbi:hypothetical protein L5876_10150 [Hyphobacterium sp. SN044]|uniref:hypothetical protein n=1 Tax=Hyphobacterium sp. SN044 TaxID=2912575 RepID=UPI001F2214C4|nr:hypothetical protein [Hyphobacterium sp. SN044]MCF8880177.1 hypothetical protein [Hyphobacterium sp. SN044]
MNAHAEQDIAWLKSLAESGAQAPLIGGRYLLLWGGLSVLATFAHGLVVAGLLPVPMASVGFIWLVYGIAGGVASRLIGSGLGDKPGATSAANRVSRAAWTTVGFGIFGYVLAIVLWTSAFGAPVLLFDSILTIAFFGYAFAFSVTAALSGLKWLYGPALLSGLAAMATPVLYGSAALYFGASAVILTAAVLPGAAMMMREPGKAA